jgi:ribonuclease P protein component
MLAREYRLPATTKLSHAQYARTPLFGVKYAKNTMQGSRFAFVVRKSIDKRAVVRNRIRRVFRSCIEELAHEIVPGYNMLFFLEKGIMDVTRDELLKEVSKTFEEKRLLKINI